ncbi:MAG TPA: sortase [Thermoleophilaceae bacterium]
MLRRRISTFLFVLGFLMVAEAVVTVSWQEPVSAFLQSRAQGTLERELERRERAALPVDERERRELASIGDAGQRLDRRLDLLAGKLARGTKEGDAVGRLEIDRVGLNAVVVNGTSEPSLRKAPGHYLGTVMPGQHGTVGIAGHRTSYGAPFRHVDRLEAGDRIVVTMPYGRFTYRVQGRRIVSPEAAGVFQRVSYQRLVLSACHPLYSASQRILVFARLESRRPLGAGVVDEPDERGMVVHVDPRKRYVRQLRRLGRRDLTLGMKGSDVRELQRLLGVPRTGTFDQLTAYAVSEFQREHGLPADGQAGRATKRLLARRPKPPSRPPTPPAVAPQAPAPEQGEAAGQPPGGPGQAPPSGQAPPPGQQVPRQQAPGQAPGRQSPG